jgi:hypothetical protein
MNADAHSRSPDGPLVAGLLIVTGASHTGKTSVIRSLLPELRPPVALLGVDRTLEHTLVKPTGEKWAEIPLAYKLIQSQLEFLLDAHWLVIVESTFTYVPKSGPGSFHKIALETIVEAAKRRGAQSVVCQLQTSAQIAARRSLEEGRLDPVVVAETGRLHREAELPRLTQAISAGNRTVGEVAADVKEHLPTRFLVP